MKFLLGILLFTSFSSTQADQSLCDQVVRLGASHVLKQADIITSYLKSSSEKSSCSTNKNPLDQLVSAIDSGNKEEFNRVLVELKDNYIFKLLSKLKPNNSKSSNQSEEFVSFLNSKFDTLNDRLSKNEKSILKKSPLKTLFVFYQYNRGLDFIKENHPDIHKDINKPFGKADSIRHMFINALAARYGMDEFVNYLSTEREKSGGYIKYKEKKWQSLSLKDHARFNEHTINNLIKCNPAIPVKTIRESEHERMLDMMVINKMDIHNNKIGIKIGKNNPCDNEANIFKKIYQQYELGNAREIINGANRCFDVSSNYKRTSYNSNQKDCYLKFSQTKVPRIREAKRQSDGSFKCF